MKKKILITLMALNVCSLQANPYTVVIHPDKNSIRFVTKPTDDNNTGGENESEQETHKIIYFNASSLKIAVGQSITLNWNVQNAQSVSISGVGGDLNQHSSITLQPTQNTIYTLTTIGLNGQSLQQTVSVEVVSPAEIVSFSANSNNVSLGDRVVFFYEVKNAISAKINNSNVDIKGNKYVVNANTVGDFSYVLEVVDSLGNKTTRTQTIKISDMNMINSFIVNKNPIATNTSLVFTWDMATPSSLTIKNNLGWSQVLTPTLKTYTYSKIHEIGEEVYTLEATNASGEKFSKSLDVKVVGLPVITSFTVPSTIYTNQTYTVNFTGDNVSKFDLRGTYQIGLGTSFAEFESGVQLKASTSPGSYSVYLRSYNEAGSIADMSRPVVVEDTPSASIATINGVRTSTTLSPNAAMELSTFSKSSGSTLVLKTSNSATADEIEFPNYAPSTVGVYKYNIAACKTVNEERRCSVPVVATVTVK